MPSIKELSKVLGESVPDTSSPHRDDFRVSLPRFL